MKYLDYPELESLSRALTFESAECKVFTRLEAYSCKAVKRERQLFKSLESQYLHSASLSPPKHLDETLASPFGRLDQAQARKTLFLLIATLNGAFPDHDFSAVDPTDFRREANPDFVLNSLGTTLLSLRSNSNAPRSFSSFPSSYDEDNRTGTQPSARGRTHGHGSASGGINHPQLGAVLDDIMCISDCEVFTFHPDTDSDPHASAEPDEEGIEVNDERYADDESLSDGNEGYGEGQDTQMSTPRRRSSNSSFNEDAGMDDAPMFDEDLMGFGFTPVQSPSGLLWATYAFFYNRKLKRILFVSVWSRRS
ncbi:Maf1 regulator, partial [Meira miltonrushii]